MDLRMSSDALHVWPRLQRTHTVLTLGFLVLLSVGGYCAPAQAQSTPDPLVVDDFDSYDVGTAPWRWKFISADKEVIAVREKARDDQRFYVVQEDDNQFLRVYTRDEAHRITQRNGVQFEWNLEERPILTWRWRVKHLPEGANEKYDGTNDAGAAVYVTFGSTWWGQPISIKYTYSSTLPVGTVVDYGSLMVLVVDSARDPGTGQWKTVTRNVIADYHQLFGEDPPNRPVAISLWSDSDSTHGEAKAAFDDIKLLRSRQ